jgi:lipopolysaccharide transport system ATP-binding protein
MGDIAIRADGLSKCYQIGLRQERFRASLRETIVDSVKKPFQRAGRLVRGESVFDAETEEVWALKDVSFEIKRGEVLGVIGRNGAGKSTLLKLLSRITEPTAGYAEIHGRIAALLEVGTGFHPELTGRENVYLNGAILGMRQREIDGKFDEIIAFSGVERFIDTPVKYYSSGMHLRLAFSVAAHLEPEIVLVDEVLAVGDASFQRKCLGKMDDVASQGRTVVFVSHNLAVVKELCQTSIVLANGSIVASGSVVDGLSHYSKSLTESDLQFALASKRWSSVRVNGEAPELATALESCDPLSIDVLLNLPDHYEEIKLICMVYDAVGNLVVHRGTSGEELVPSSLDAGTYRIKVDIPPLWLAPGIYTLYFKFLGVRDGTAREKENSDAVLLDVFGDARDTSRALLAPPTAWELRPEPVLQEKTA